jgi:hypothetical protein
LAYNQAGSKHLILFQTAKIYLHAQRCVETRWKGLMAVEIYVCHPPRAEAKATGSLARLKGTDGMFWHAEVTVTCASIGLGISAAGQNSRRHVRRNIGSGLNGGLARAIVEIIHALDDHETYTMASALQRRYHVK